MTTRLLPKSVAIALALALALALPTVVPSAAFAQAPRPDAKGYEVEWVYRVRYGFIDEWWDIFRKYEVPILDRAKHMARLRFLETRRGDRADAVQGPRDAQARRAPPLGADGQSLGPADLPGRLDQVALRPRGGCRHMPSELLMSCSVASRSGFI